MATSRARPRASAAPDPVADPRPVAAVPAVRVVAGTAFELIAQLTAFASGPARASLESGKPWIREVRRLAGSDLSHRAESNSLSLYAELAPIALATDPPHDPGQLLDRLRLMAPDELRYRLLGGAAPPNRAMVSEGAFDRAIAGDAAALAELHGAMGVSPVAKATITRLATAPAAQTKADVLDLVGTWAERVFLHVDPVAGEVIARDVEARRRRLANGDPVDAVRDALNGVELHPGPWVEAIVIVPTVAMRPYVVPVDTETGVIYLCPVADESFDADPAMPPRRLAKVAAALGDPLRLRILRLLVDEELGATELATRLGVDRTTLHHHLGILRSAGLLAINDDGTGGWRYARRYDGVADATQALAAFLAASPVTTSPPPPSRRRGA
jgi:DNA-binding transcriptional ArsR family regulator